MLHRLSEAKVQGGGELHEAREESVPAVPGRCAVSVPRESAVLEPDKEVEPTAYSEQFSAWSRRRERELLCSTGNSALRSLRASLASSKITPDFKSVISAGVSTGFSHHKPKMSGLMDELHCVQRSDTTSGNELRESKVTEEGNQALPEALNINSDDILRVAFKLIREYSNHRKAIVMTLSSLALAERVLINKRSLE
ncbi:hypothetical protein NDU88_004261 [Pleurodeles waltl]|uniref:Uncharacterized protein n=1 Tax=Pleurodeles waltl TaxID=8319 RepID=A0AAV7WX80_PLEWA|nr:hypothetical protein NDU88_004261 [Pleurodeles waltl]